MSEGIITVSPKEGFTIVDPFSGEVLTAAKRVRHDSYWERMKDQGAIEFIDVTEESAKDAI